jgi:hypothetical protein
MKKEPCFMLLFYLIFSFSGSVFALGEKTIAVGGISSWRDVTVRSGVMEISMVRPYPVLALSSAAQGTADLSLSFDEGRPDLYRDSSGLYQVISSPALGAADRLWARFGEGAVLFSGDAGPAGSLVIEPRDQRAVFAQGNLIRDFSLEFWLYPLNMENGEQILSWLASVKTPANEYIFQRIQCAAVKNRLQWSFLDFFRPPEPGPALAAKKADIVLTGDKALTPKSWSHHLIRFDADTGLLEYLVNGRLEAMAYANASGREGSEVYAPVAGAGGSFILGSRYSGLIDEFRIRGGWVENPSLRKYHRRAGHIETRVIDLGEGNSGILTVEAAGGRTSLGDGRLHGEYSPHGNVRFADNAELQFFIRAADSPYYWSDADWRTFTPGTEFPVSLRGRYVQIAVDFYPSADGEASPYLEELRIVYRPDEAPLPPAHVRAVAKDGAVELSWKDSSDLDTMGYLVYYGDARGEYFGDHAILGSSPINAGKRTSLRIEGLRNGELYYFAVAAYDRAVFRGDGQGDSGFHAGEFSREVTARPLRMIE